MKITPDILKSMSFEETLDLCKTIRSFLVDSVSDTGGHLASNLGIVEITVALHRIFDSPTDKIVWDVGHQAYVHKLLTDRWDQFSTLRQLNGISGFPRRSESEHDSFDTGHSSTSLSAAMGLAYAKKLRGENGRAIAVIGDGAMTGGMAYEAINHIGSQKLPLIIVLNDNGMSISKNVGALNYHLSKMRSGKKYIGIKRRIAINYPKIKGLLERIKNSIKYMMLPSAFFEELGLKYLGPIDGHNLKSLETVMKHACHFDVPVIIHAMTTKGKGYAVAEENPQEFHGVAPQKKKPSANGLTTTMSNGLVVADTLIKTAQSDKGVVAITAAMLQGTGLYAFAEKFPDRIFDVGIAEQHAVTLAAGMAAGGLRPVVSIYSSFLQRAYDQILHDVCLQNLPVVFTVDRAGIVGEDGNTHHGIFDIAYLTQMPNIVCLSPSTQEELREMMELALKYNGPIAIRYPRNPLPSQVNAEAVQIGKWEMCAPVSDVMIVATGTMMSVAKQVAQNLSHYGMAAGVYNARSIKPMDFDALKKLEQCRRVYTIEEGVLPGGMGEHIAGYLACKGVNVRSFGLSERPSEHGKVQQLLQLAGLTANQIMDSILASEGIFHEGKSQA